MGDSFVLVECSIAYSRWVLVAEGVARQSFCGSQRKPLLKMEHRGGLHSLARVGLAEYDRFHRSGEALTRSRAGRV